MGDALEPLLSTGPLLYALELDEGPLLDALELDEGPLLDALELDEGPLPYALELDEGPLLDALELDEGPLLYALELDEGPLLYALELDEGPLLDAVGRARDELGARSVLRHVLQTLARVCVVDEAAVGAVLPLLRRLAVDAHLQRRHVTSGVRLHAAAARAQRAVARLLEHERRVVHVRPAVHHVQLLVVVGDAARAVSGARAQLAEDAHGGRRHDDVARHPGHVPAERAARRRLLDDGATLLQREQLVLRQFAVGTCGQTSVLLPVGETQEKCH